MKRLSFSQLALASGLLTLVGCSSTTTTVQHGDPLLNSARWVMLPIANYSETPQAGERVQELLETVLRRMAVNVVDRSPPAKEDEAHLVMGDRQRYDEARAWAHTQPFEYAVTGSVEEWRYKSGLDGDPAVGLSIRVVDLKTDRIAWSASGTKTGTGGDNASGVALQLLGDLLHEMSFTR